jgi:predicted metal-dependent phosphoesterase TrpH
MNSVFRYDTTGRWLKGNTHIHSVASDGGLAVPDIARLYAGAGYDFLFCTDHWRASDVTLFGDELPLLLLDGVELDGCDSHGTYYHIVCLGRFTGLSQDMGLDAALSSAREQGGLLILAHPCWCDNTIEEAVRYIELEDLQGRRAWTNNLFLPAATS